MTASEEVTLDVSRFVRPMPEMFSWRTAEYWRWYDAQHTARVRPLDADELTKFLMDHIPCTYDQAEHDVAFDSNALSGDVERWERFAKLTGGAKVSVPLDYYLERPWLGIWADQAPSRYRFADLELRSAA